MWCPQVGAKGFQVLSCSRKGGMEVTAAHLHCYCPKGNLCKILSRKGNSKKCLQMVPPVSFPKKKGKTLFLPLFPHLSLQLLVP